MLIPNTAEGCVAVHTTMYIDTVLNIPTNTQPKEVSVVNLTTVFMLFKNMVNDEGYELADDGYLRLFKIVMEITLLRICDLADSGLPEENPNNAMLQSLAYELTQHVHKKYLSDLNNDHDTVADILAIGKEIKLHELINTEKGETNIPVRWEYINGVLLLHSCVIAG